MFTYVEGFAAGPELEKQIKKYKKLYKPHRKVGVNTENTISPKILVCLRIPFVISCENVLNFTYFSDMLFHSYIHVHILVPITYFQIAVNIHKL